MRNLSEEELQKLLRDNPALKPEAPQGQKKVMKEGAGGKYHVAAKEDRIYNGVLYASLKEKLFAQSLDLRKQAGEITFWLR